MDRLGRTALLWACILALTTALSEAGVVGVKSKAQSQQTDGITPELTPKSDKKFFGKQGDYSKDDRPKANNLHFDHPYPAVQDTGDFDKDYVKDENGDNGAWQAQSEYDRLRIRLRKEKKDVSEALRKKIKEEEELKRAARKQQEAKDMAEKAQEEKMLASQMNVTDKTADEGKPVDVESAVVMKDAAMKSLQDCKDELKEAQAKLKQVMEKLDAAKEKQATAKKQLQEKEDEEFAAAKKEKELEEVVDKEKKEHEDAKTAVEKQKEIVEKMESDLQAAAKKVNTIRGAADADGGVYPTKSDKSAAPATVSPFVGAMLTALMAFLVGWQ